MRIGEARLFVMDRLIHLTFKYYESVNTLHNASNILRLRRETQDDVELRSEFPGA